MQLSPNLPSFSFNPIHMSLSLVIWLSIAGINFWFVVWANPHVPGTIQVILTLILALLSPKQLAAELSIQHNGADQYVVSICDMIGHFK
jgi:hypothetical protein